MWQRVLGGGSQRTQPSARKQAQAVLHNRIPAVQACRTCLHTQQLMLSAPDEVTLALRHLSRLQQQLASLKAEEERLDGKPDP